MLLTGYYDNGGGGNRWDGVQIKVCQALAFRSASGIFPFNVYTACFSSPTILTILTLIYAFRCMV